MLYHQVVKKASQRKHFTKLELSIFFPSVIIKFHYKKNNKLLSSDSVYPPAVHLDLQHLAKELTGGSFDSTLLMKYNCCKIQNQMAAKSRPVYTKLMIMNKHFQVFIQQNCEGGKIHVF